jgi:phosphoribosylamine--glycine ligase
VCVVLAAQGYPDTPRKGDVIHGLEVAAAESDVSVLHAGTTRAPNGDVLTAGGRVLGVTGRGPTLQAAHARAYRAAQKIEFAGMQFRRDIAGRAGLVLDNEGAPGPL